MGCIKKHLIKYFKEKRRGNEGKEQMGSGGVESVLEGRIYQKEAARGEGRNKAKEGRSKREEQSGNRTKSVTQHMTKEKRSTREDTTLSDTL